MNVADGQLPGPDLWEKVHKRCKNAAPYAVRADKKRKGERAPVEVVDLLDRCIVCDQLVTSTYPYRRAFSMYLTEKTRLTESRILVVVHEGCVEKGAALAVGQGYTLRHEVGEERPPRPWIDL